MNRQNERKEFLRQRWEVLLTVTKLTEEIQAGIELDQGIFRFKMLPFIALERTHPWASNPPTGTRITSFTKTSYALAWSINRALLEADHLSRTWAPNGNRWVLDSKTPTSYPILEDIEGKMIEWLPRVEYVRIAHPTAMFLSLQLRQGRVVDEDHILSIATRVASRHMPVIVAAGNWGVFGEGSLSPLAKLPWTIAVGATSDEEGTQRLTESSMGVPDSDLKSGVTVVAYGENKFKPGTFGTSYAVPRATAQIQLLTAFVLQIKQIVNTKSSGKLGGVPLLLRISVDTGFTDFDPRPSLPLPLIPVIGVDQFSVLKVIDILQQFDVQINIEPDPIIIRRMLIESARPIPNLKTHEVGAGFVSTEGTLKYLLEFNGLNIVELFADDVSLDDQTWNRLKQIGLAESTELDLLDDVSRRSGLVYSIDFHTYQIYASMRDPEIRVGEKGFYKEPSQYSWPPPLSSETY